MAEIKTIRGIVADIWDKDKSSGKGCFTIVKLEGSDEAYFDFSGKARKAVIHIDDEVGIQYSDNGSKKLLEITKLNQEKQTELPQGIIKHKIARDPEPPREDPTAWRIARTVALKIMAELSWAKEKNPGALLPEDYDTVDSLATYIVTGKHPEPEKPAKKKGAK